MAEATITQYADLAEDAAGNKVMVGLEPNLGSAKVTYTSSTQSAALNVRTRFIRVSMEAAAGHIRVGTNPMATDGDPYLAAGAAEYFGVNQSVGTLKVAVYDGST